MSTLTQRGCLRRRDLPKPSTLVDLRRVTVEYRHSNALGVPPGNFDIISVTAEDGQPIEPQEYWFFAQEGGLWFPQDADSALTQDNSGKWERR
jgi:hypothetical protein